MGDRKKKPPAGASRLRGVAVVLGCPDLRLCPLQRDGAHYADYDDLYQGPRSGGGEVE